MNCLLQNKKTKDRQPVWRDPSDPEPKKVKAYEHVLSPDSSSSSDDEDYDLIAGEVRSKKINLESKELKFKHLVNINNQRSFSGSVKQVKFNPKSRVALVALAKGQVDLYQVDGEENKYLQNIKLPFTKQPCCSFKLDGESVIITAENYHGSFLTYHMSGDLKRYSLERGETITDFVMAEDYMACRVEGSPQVMILSAKTYEKLFSINLNEPAKAIQLTGKEIFVAGDTGKVYVWDLRKTSCCRHRFQDEGSNRATSLSITSNQLSVGSDCGVVNTYELDTCLREKFPTPLKTYANLKTPIDILRHNHSGELLLIGSSEASEAFRMIHTLSGTVYRNFPVQKKRYGHLMDADFSPSGGYLALGCSRGRANLCRIPYYRSY